MVTGENLRAINFMFSYLTEEAFPVNVERPNSTDIKIYATLDSLIPTQVGFIGVFPLLLGIFGIIIQIRRKRK